jgi:hypothetical protein
MFSTTDLMIKVVPDATRGAVGEDCGDTCSVTDTCTPYTGVNLEAEQRRRAEDLATLKAALHLELARAGGRRAPIA